jgi:predicted regulator of Ras-like GTPase activity (Roadblock/LC7/MglB family)
MSEAQAFDDVAFLLSTFVQRTPGVTDAIVVSSDGLLLAASQGVARDAAERFAAAASGLISLAHAAATPFEGGRVSEIIIECQGGFIFVTGISNGSSLAVTAESTCDVGRVGYEMGGMVLRCADALTPRLRGGSQSPAPS